MSPQPQPVTLPFVFSAPLDVPDTEVPLCFDPSVYPGSYPPTVGQDPEVNYRQDVKGEAGFELQLDLIFNDSDEVEVVVKTCKEYNGSLIVSSKATADSVDADKTVITPQTVSIKKTDWGTARITIPLAFFTPFSNFCQIFVKDISAGTPATRAQLHGFDLVYGSSGF